MSSVPGEEEKKEEEEEEIQQEATILSTVWSYITWIPSVLFNSLVWIKDLIVGREDATGNLVGQAFATSIEARLRELGL